MENYKREKRESERKWAAIRRQKKYKRWNMLTDEIISLTLLLLILISWRKLKKKQKKQRKNLLSEVIPAIMSMLLFVDHAPVRGLVGNECGSRIIRCIV